MQIKTNVHFSSRQLITGATWGIISAFLYSLGPLFIIFLRTTALDTFMLVTVQEFLSWILVVFIAKNPLQNLRQIFKNCRSVLGGIVIITGIFGGPIAQVFYVLSISLAAQMSATATVLVNIAPIFTAILSRLLLQEKLSFFAWLGLVMTFLSVLGLVTYQMINEFFAQQNSAGDSSQLWQYATWAIVLSFITAILYAVESTIVHYAMSKAKNPLSNREVVALKSFTSSWFMLILVLPVASWVGGYYGYQGWVQFKVFGEYQGLATLFILLSSIAMAVGRMMYFKSVKVLNASYGMTCQLMMVIWTPVIALIFYGVYRAMGSDWGLVNSPALVLELNKLYNGATQWAYYLFLIPILGGLIMLIFNENFFKQKKKGIWQPPLEVK